MKPSPENQFSQIIAQGEASVFLRQDFEHLGSYGQVGKALRYLIDKKILVRVGHGIYVKAVITPNGNAVPAISLVAIGFALMAKLGLEVDLGESARNYRDGKSTQVPMSSVIDIGQARINRRIRWRKKELRYERKLPINCGN